MEWKYVKELNSEELITEFEIEYKCKLPAEYIACIKEHNGGRPEKKAFKTRSGAERELKSFLSFNKNDRETIWKINEWNKDELSEKYIAFSIDNFGNLICLDKETGEVVFVELESLKVEVIESSFKKFYDNLYN